jgi:hypothetical protein
MDCIPFFENIYDILLPEPPTPESTNFLKNIDDYWSSEGGIKDGIFDKMDQYINNKLDGIVNDDVTIKTMVYDTINMEIRMAKKDGNLSKGLITRELCDRTGDFSKIPFIPIKSISPRTKLSGETLRPDQLKTYIVFGHGTVLSYPEKGKRVKTHFEIPNNTYIITLSTIGNPTRFTPFVESLRDKIKRNRHFFEHGNTTRTQTEAVRYLEEHYLANSPEPTFFKNHLPGDDMNNSVLLIDDSNPNFGIFEDPDFDVNIKREFVDDKNGTTIEDLIKRGGPGIYFMVNCRVFNRRAFINNYCVPLIYIINSHSIKSRVNSILETDGDVNDKIDSLISILQQFKTIPLYHDLSEPNKMVVLKTVSQGLVLFKNMSEIMSNFDMFLWTLYEKDTSQGSPRAISRQISEGTQGYVPPEKKIYNITMGLSHINYAFNTKYNIKSKVTEILLDPDPISQKRKLVNLIYPILSDISFYGKELEVSNLIAQTFIDARSYDEGLSKLKPMFDTEFVKTGKMQVVDRYPTQLLEIIDITTVQDLRDLFTQILVEIHAPGEMDYINNILRPSGQLGDFQDIHPYIKRFVKEIFTMDIDPVLKEEIIEKIVEEIIKLNTSGTIDDDRFINELTDYFTTRLQLSGGARKSNRRKSNRRKSNRRKSRSNRRNSNRRSNRRNI